MKPGRMRRFMSGPRADLVEDRAVGEELRMGLVPVAEQVLEREQVYLRELVRVLRHHLRRARAVVVLRGDLLALRRRHR